MQYIAYLDEFGHIGPFVSRTHPQHKTSPVFGLGGLVLPINKVRAFGTWFYQLKCNLLRFEIDQSHLPPYQWEKKGASLYTTQNVLTYRELRAATFRLINRIDNDGGVVFYVGIQKTHPPERSNSKRLYTSVLRESIKRLDQFCKARNSSFMMILDEQNEARRHSCGDTDFRTQIVAEASREMYANSRTSMIEPPIQAESHLFQTLQCADWLCGLIGRIGAYRCCADQYPDLNWTETYFVHRLARVSNGSGIRKDRDYLPAA